MSLIVDAFLHPGFTLLCACRFFLFASLLLADQLVDNRPEAAAALSVPAGPDPEMILQAERLADRLESLATALENEGSPS